MPSGRHTKKREARVPERRREVRVPVQDVAVEVVSPQGVPVSQEFCGIANISVGGMLFRTAHPYDISQEVHLTFKAPQNPAIVHTTATVVHWHVTAEGKYVGVQFNGLGAPERASIEAYVKRMQDD